MQEAPKPAQNITVVFPAPGSNGITPSVGTRVLDQEGNELRVSRIELIAEPGEPWRANISTLPGFSGSVTAQASSMPAIGEYWEGQGGIFGGTMLDGQRRWHLILPTTPEASIEETTWGKYGSEIPGNFSTRDGLHNTQLILAAEPTNKIATQFSALNIEGHADFYWPSQFEQNILCANLQHQFQKKYHWSSTQYSASLAWVQDFGDGGQYIDFKDTKLSARAVRRILVIE